MIDIKNPLEKAELNINCEYMDLFDMSAHNERKIYLNDEIEAISAHDVIFEIMRINAEDKRKHNYEGLRQVCGTIRKIQSL